AHHGPHLLVPGDDGHEPVDPRVADRGGDVAAGNPHAPFVLEGDRVLTRELAELRLLVERQVVLHREPRQRAVHRPRVEVAEAQPLRQGAGDGALAGPGGAVDGDDHLWATESSRSKNPGKDTVT